MKKRAFNRYTKKGQLVPGSLVVTTKGGYPDKTSLWKEVPVSIATNNTTGNIVAGSTIQATYVQPTYPINYPTFSVNTTGPTTAFGSIYLGINQTVNSLAEHVAILNQYYSNIGNFYIQGLNVILTFADAGAAIFSNVNIEDLQLSITND